MDAENIKEQWSRANAVEISLEGFPNPAAIYKVENPDDESHNQEDPLSDSDRVGSPWLETLQDQISGTELKGDIWAGSCWAKMIWGGAWPYISGWIWITP